MIEGNREATEKSIRTDLLDAHDESSFSSSFNRIFLLEKDRTEQNRTEQNRGGEHRIEKQNERKSSGGSKRDLRLFSSSNK